MSATILKLFLKIYFTENRKCSMGFEKCLFDSLYYLIVAQLSQSFVNDFIEIIILIVQRHPIKIALVIFLHFTSEFNFKIYIRLEWHVDNWLLLHSLDCIEFHLLFTFIALTFRLTILDNYGEFFLPA